MTPSVLSRRLDFRKVEKSWNIGTWASKHPGTNNVMFETETSGDKRVMQLHLVHLCQLFSWLHVQVVFAPCHCGWIHNGHELHWGVSSCRMQQECFEFTSNNHQKSQQLTYKTNTKKSAKEFFQSTLCKSVRETNPWLTLTDWNDKEWLEQQTPMQYDALTWEIELELMRGVMIGTQLRLTKILSLPILHQKILPNFHQSQFFLHCQGSL